MVNCGSSLETPIGLRFTEVETCGGCLLSTVKLTEACCETLVKLSYVVTSYCRSPPYPSPAGSGMRDTDADLPTGAGGREALE